MKNEQVEVVNATGLHARPAAVFATQAAGFSSKIEIRNVSKDSAFKDAKSMISIMTLAATQGDVVELRAEGEDEQQAVSELVKLIREGFDE